MTLANIPHVEPSAFHSYLSQVGPLFAASQRAEADMPASPGPRKDRGDDTGAGHNDQSRPRIKSRQGSVASISSLAPAEPPPLHVRRSSGAVSKRQLAGTQLSTIPAVYFDENFHLENPRTFDIVSERSEVLRSPLDGKAPAGENGAALQPRKMLATNAILQEKLSWYLDTVEIHLISSISTASKSFFTALGSLKELHSEAARSVAQIQKLRQDLGKLDEKMAVGGLEIVAMKQRRENLRRLGDAMLQLRYIVEGAEHCQQLVDDGELETAIDRIDMLEEFTCGAVEASADLSWLCKQRPRQLLDLRRLRCLDGFAEGMEQLRLRVGKGYETRFLNILLTDLREHVKRESYQETLRRWAHAAQRSKGFSHSRTVSVGPAYLQTSSELRRDLLAVLSGLGRSKYTTTATKAFWDAAMKEMKKMIQRHLPSSSDDDAESVVSTSTRSSRTGNRSEKSAILARNLRALGSEDAEELFTKIYCAVGEALRRLQFQVKLLLDVTSGRALSPPTSGGGGRSPQRSLSVNTIEGLIGGGYQPAAAVENLQEQLMQALDMSSLLGQAVDTAQAQITKILRVRSEESVRLELRPFLRYFTLNRLFADECEAVSGRSGTALRGVVDVQIKEWIAVLAERERQQLAEVMEKDRWDAQDFTEKDSVVLEQLLQAMQSDPAPWLAQAYVWEADEDFPVNGLFVGKPSMPADETNSAKEKTRSAVIDDEKYMLVKSAIKLLHGLGDFCSLIACLPRLTPELSASILDYLRLFTSRTNQLVLFAGATKSAGLERINTKHLALASQALGFVVVLARHIREFARRKGGAAAAGGFDGVLRSTQNNQLSIHEKLVAIMTMRAQAHAKELRRVEYDAEGAADDEAPPGTEGRISRYMETLTKETATLHRVLSRHLPELTVGMIVGPVFDSYRDVLGEAFGGVVVKTAAGKRRYVWRCCPI